MAIDPRMLEEALRMNDGQAPTQRSGGVMDMLTPNFNQVQFAEAGALPPLDLNLNFDPMEYLNVSSSTPFALKDGIEKEIESILTNADAGDEEDGLRAIAALGLDGADASPEEKSQGYKEFSDLVQEGGIGAVEEFVRSIYAPDDNEEAIPEWALPASVFGTFLMNEPGDWKQAVLQARGKTAATMLRKRTADKTAKDALDLDIRKKALDLYTASKAGNKPTATSLVGLVGKVTPASLAKYETSGKLSDLVLISDTKDVGDLLKDFTAASVAKYQKSGDYNDLVRVPGKGDKGTTDLDFLKEFTPASVQEYLKNGKTDASVLIRKPSNTAKSTENLFDLLETYTAESIDAYKISNRFSDLVPKDPYAMDYPDVSATKELNEQAITKMTQEPFINGLIDKDDATKLAQLKKYRMLYMQTIDSASERTEGETVRERLPFGELTPSQFALSIGLDIEDPKINQIVTIPEVKLPKASQEDLLQANALYRLEQQWSVLGKILEVAPENITGIKGEWWKSTPAKILADVIPGIEIPSEATMAAFYTNLAEVDLIEEILKEARFSDEDRKLVREVISGKPFKNKQDFLLRWDNINKKIQDGIQGIEFVLEGRRVPDNLRTNSSMSTDDLAGRRANLLKIVQGDG